jgi:hypothetical protein
VTIVELCEKDQIEAARRRVDDVAHCLARHRIKAAVRVETQVRSSGADQLVGLALAEGADLLGRPKTTFAPLSGRTGRFHRTLLFPTSSYGSAGAGIS